MIRIRCFKKNKPSFLAGIFPFLLIFPANTAFGEEMSVIRAAIQTLKGYTPKQRYTRAELLKLETSTPELVAQGKVVYQKICQQCHGVDGKGDGPKAHIISTVGDKAPVSFREKDNNWVHGSSGKSMFVTMSFGLMGKRVSLRNIYSMTPQDRWAVIHYIHTLMPDTPRTGLADSQYESAIQDDLIDE